MEALRIRSRKRKPSPWARRQHKKRHAEKRLDARSSTRGALREGWGVYQQHAACPTHSFVELARLIDPGMSKNDKTSIVADAIRSITQLRAENNQLRQLNKFLQEKVTEFEQQRAQAMLHAGPQYIMPGYAGIVWHMTKVLPTFTHNPHSSCWHAAYAYGNGNADGRRQACHVGCCPRAGIHLVAASCPRLVASTVHT